MRRLSPILLLLLAVAGQAETIILTDRDPPRFRPSVYEQVDAAERIVLARAESASGNGVLLRIEEVLKGEKTATVQLRGSFESRGAKPDAYQILDYHNYRDGALYLLYLDREDSRWALSAGYARHEVTRDEEWVQSVRHLAGVSQLDDAGREKEALRDLRAAVEADRDGRYPPGLARLIDLHFATPSPAKPFSDLMDLYDAAETTAERLAVLSALVEGEHPETAAFFRGLLFEREPAWLLEPAADWFYDHPEELPQIKDLARIYLGYPPDEREPLLRLIQLVAEPRDAQLLWSLVAPSSRTEKRVLIEQVLGPNESEAMLERLALPEDEGLKVDLIAIWLKEGANWGGTHRLGGLLGRDADRKWRSAANVRQLVEAFAGSRNRATRLEILWEILRRSGGKERPLLWRLLGQAQSQEADLIVEWFAAHPPSVPALANSYRRAVSEEARYRVLWVVAATHPDELEHMVPEGKDPLRLQRLVQASLSCPNETTRNDMAAEVAKRLASAEDMPAMLEFLRGATTRDAARLVPWFIEHPSSEAAEVLRRRFSATPMQIDANLDQALAAAGDPEVLDLALRVLHRTGGEQDEWAIGVLARSPLPAALEQAQRMLERADVPFQRLLWELTGPVNATPWRDWFLKEILRSATIDEEVWQQALKALRWDSGDVDEEEWRRVSGRPSP